MNHVNRDRLLAGSSPLGLERKEAGDPSLAELKNAIAGMATAWEEFKTKNDDRLKQIEKKGSADVVTREEVDRINKAIDEHKAAVDKALAGVKRPQLDDGRSKKEMTPELAEYSTKFEQFFRYGEEKVGGKYALAELQQKALSTQVDAEGGFTVRPEMESTIDATLKEVSPIRGIAGQRSISTSAYKKLVNVHGTTSGWVGENDSRPQTLASQLNELEYTVGEMYAMPAATQTLLDDSAINIDQWIADEVTLEFAYQEARAFVLGDGVKKPRGFLSYQNVADASWAYGKIGYIATGQNGGFATSNPGDKLIDIAYAVKAGYRTGSRWVMNRKTLAEVRKLKDGDGNYLWQPSFQATGLNILLIGYGVTEAEDMPAIANGSFSIAFGDFRRGYLVIDRVGVRVLRDPYTAKPYVLFYTTKRVGGGVQNFECIKLLKFANS